MSAPLQKMARWPTCTKSAVAILLVAACQLVIALESTGRGDAELLRELAFAFRQNISGIQTWQATAERTNTEFGVADPRPEATPSKQLVQHIMFAADRATGNMRVDVAFDEVQGEVRDARNPAAEPKYAPMRPFTKHIQTEDGEIYRFFGTQSEGPDPGAQLVYERAENTKLEGRADYFEPTWCFGLDADKNQANELPELLLKFADAAGSGPLPKNVEIKRNGSKVLLDVNVGDSKNSYRFDLAKGGVLETAHFELRGAVTETDIDYECKGSTWYPTKHTYKIVHSEAPGRPAMTLIKQTVFRSQVVNEPLDVSLFSPESLGVPVGNIVVDRRHPETPIAFRYPGPLGTARETLGHLAALTAGTPQTQPLPVTSVTSEEDGKVAARQIPAITVVSRAKSIWWITLLVIVVTVIGAVSIVWAVRRRRRGAAR